MVHDDVIKWRHFPRYWPFVRGIHRSPVNPPHKGQWRRALMYSLICVWIIGWVNNHEARDMRRYRAHYDVTVMLQIAISLKEQSRSLSKRITLGHKNIFAKLDPCEGNEQVAVNCIPSVYALGLSICSKRGSHYTQESRINKWYRRLWRI